jgi:hypothetical protein
MSKPNIYALVKTICVENGDLCFSLDNLPHVVSSSSDLNTIFIKNNTSAAIQLHRTMYNKYTKYMAK